MDTASLLSLIDAFYEPGFDLDKAVARFTDGTAPEELRPHQLKVHPNDATIAAVWLETVDPIAPSKEPYLAGVVIDFAEPALLELVTLAERFGLAREVPRLKPDHPRPYQFLVKGTPLEGYVTLSVKLGDEEAEPKRVERAILRRFAANAARAT